MNYEFIGGIFKDGTKSFIKIPFNVWDVCNEKGNIPVKVTIQNYTYECKLVPKGNGNYYIPVTKADLKNINIENIMGISFEMINYLSRINKNSPYSLQNPIRNINSIELVTQPDNGLCIQACVAMLAGISIQETINLMNSKKCQASFSKFIETLDYLGIGHSAKMVYKVDENYKKLKCCIINSKGHLLVYYDNKYYDPSNGVLDELDINKITGYLEIIM